MSLFVDKLKYLTTKRPTFSAGHGMVTKESREWEKGYRDRWNHEKIIRSTHGNNCTGSCSWKIYVKGGIVTWETQQTDYPRTRPDIPNHEPRGCPRGASYSWFLYSANRVKFPLVRGSLLKAWRQHREKLHPVDAWQAIVSDPVTLKKYQSERGRGGFLRARWEEVNDIVAAANIYTAKTYGPDRIAGFSPIPAMSMVSFAAGSRYLSLIGGVAVSFYDWYCDLPPSSPQTWGEKTDVLESAEWYSANYILMWGSNVPQTRSPDAHFLAEVRYKGTKVVAIYPDYAEGAKFGDLWLHPKQGTDAALGMAMGHVILKEFHVSGHSDYFDRYCRQYSDMPMLVCMEYKDGSYIPGRYLRAADMVDAMGERNNPDWKPLVIDELTEDMVVPMGSVGFRWGQEDNGQPTDDKGKWNLKDQSSQGRSIKPRLSLVKKHDAVVEAAFPYFGNVEHDHFHSTDHPDVLMRNVPVRKVQTRGGEVLVATVYDLLIANYGVDQGLGGSDIVTNFDDDLPYTPAWQEKITGVPRSKVIQVAREFAQNAHKTEGTSMVILGAGMNHWYHNDMSYRAIINMLVMCGCVGKTGGGWAHYVGQEKLRPEAGWTVLSTASDWNRPRRTVNGTSYFYAHTDQWRYESMKMEDILSPLADKEKFSGSMIDFNVRAERMGWLPSAPHFDRNPLELGREALAAGIDPKSHIVSELQSGKLKFASEDPDNSNNYPRNLFVWRSNLLGSSSKGHEYFLKHLLGTKNGVQGKDLGETGAVKPEEVVWRDEAPEGKLDLLVTLDFRMSTTCLYSDIVLPTATWYEKNDLNTSDLHPFIHPFSKAVDPGWQSRNDWEIYKGFAKHVSELSDGHLGVERDMVAIAIQHDTEGEIAQPLDVKDWRKGECAAIPGQTMPNFKVVERDYSAIYDKYTALGPLIDTEGVESKGVSWKLGSELGIVGQLNEYVTSTGVAKGRPKIDDDIDAAEVVLSLAPETNGDVAVRAWEALSEQTGIQHKHLAEDRQYERIRFRDIQEQPRKVITSPTWSGVESEEVSYNASYINVHELVPWRTLTGRQQLYQDHAWMRAFGEGFCSYRPPVSLRSTSELLGAKPNGNKELTLNFVTPHQKWAIHSTHADNLILLTLARGGPIVWVSEVDAKKIDVEDNDWIELFNVNGALSARAVVSQRVPEGMMMMYHAQEKVVNVPGSETTKDTRGIHNSVTRIVMKPTHMIGGYAHLCYGFNYYGTVGSNRDTFAIIRKMNKVDWRDSSESNGAGV